MPVNNLLEADPSLIESSLRIVKDAAENDLMNAVMDGDLDKLQQQMDKGRESCVITPEPGVCIKILTLIDQQKFFVNLCQSDAIPQPETISKAALIDQLNNPDQSSFRIPMSISELRTADLKGAPVQCCDVVINPQFFALSQAEELFGDFLIQVMIEAIDGKYNVQLDGGKCVVLKNRKQLGTLVKHRIKKRDIETVNDAYHKPPNDAVRLRLAELDERSGANKHRKLLIEELPDSGAKKATVTSEGDVLAANSRLVLDRSDGTLIAEFYLPNVHNAAEILLDVGPDRLRVQVERLGLLRDGFIKPEIDTERVQTEWIAERSVLVVRAAALVF